MDPFVYVSKQNIFRFRELLKLESGPARLRDWQKLLIDEKIDSGSGYERLEDINREIAKAEQRIELQRMLVANMRREGRDATVGQALLERLISIQAMYRQYRQVIQASIDRNRL
jgi:hypothetical protein